MAFYQITYNKQYVGASRGQHRAAPSLEPKAASTPLPEQTSWAPGGYYAQGEGLLIQVTR